MDNAATFDLINGWVRRNEPLTPTKICELHTLVLAGSISASLGGRIRDKAPGDAERITRQMSGWCAEFNDARTRAFGLRDEFLKALADLHLRFYEISPFREGNGRTNRLLMFYFSLQHKRELLIVHDSYYRIIMQICRQNGSAEYLVKYLKALGDEIQRQNLLAELERLAF